MRILYVEDEEELSETVCRGLRRCSYAVDAVYDGNEALDYYHTYEYDVIVLDLNIPGMDGLEVLRQIRQTDCKTKILILSARNAVDDRVKGLNMGANDYLTKPFDFLELTARIRALLRREFASKPSILKEGKLSIDVSKHKVTYDDIVLNLTLKEYSLLKYLVQNKDKVISSEELINHVWDENTDPFTTVIRVHVYSLRKKLTAVSGNENMIKTIKGVGYLFGGITSE